MILTHKTEIFPNKLQQQALERNFGVRRFYFNIAIHFLRKEYGDLKENRKSLTKKLIMSLRKDLFREKYYEIVRTASSHIIDTALEDVMFALNTLWKHKVKDIKYRKKKYSNTCRFFKKTPEALQSDGISKILKLPSLKEIEMAEPLRWKNADIKTVTVKKIANRFFASITCEIPDCDRPEKTYKHLGIDWGISSYITGFDGSNLLESDFEKKTLDTLDERINKYQRKLSKKVLNSKNFTKTKTKLQQNYLDFNNYRDDFIKKLVKNLSDKYDSVTLEDLGMRFVTSNRRLAHKAKQKPFYLLKVAFINKFSQLGKKVYLVPKTFPSTQTCSNCGNVKTGKEKLILGEKIYNCKHCGYIINRDVNAAINLFTYKNLKEASLES